MVPSAFVRRIEMCSRSRTIESPTPQGLERRGCVAHRPGISYNDDIALSNIRGFDITIVVKSLGAKALDMKLRRRFSVRQGSLIGVALAHQDTFQLQRVGQKTVGVPFDYKFQGTHMLRLSWLGEFADVFAMTEFDFRIDSIFSEIL
jgi:hypothetical protein